MQDLDPQKKPPSAGSNLLGFGSLVLLVGIMAVWWSYPFPDGKPPTIADFFLFFGREAIWSCSSAWQAF